MSDEPFGRQLKPVKVTVSEGNLEDREYWVNRLKGYLRHQPCSIQGDSSHVSFTIYPSANND